MAENDLEFRLGRALDGIPFGWPHIWIILVLSLAGYTEAYDAALTGSLIVLAKHPLGLTESDITWLVVGPTAVLCAAMLVGSFVSDRYSRKCILQLGLVISTVFTLALPLAHTAQQLIALRMLGGIGFGIALPAAYPIGAELLPARHRRTFGALYEIVLALAVTSIPLIGYLTAGRADGWMFLALPGGVTLFFVPILVHYVVPESPRWYLSRGNPTAAIAAVNRIIARTGNRVARIDSAAARGWSAQACPLPSYTALFAPGQLRATAVATLVWLAALVSYYLFSFLLPKALVSQGYAVQVSFGLSTLLFLVTIPGKILNGWMMERLGRRLTIFLVLFVSIFGLALMVAAHRVAGSIFGMPGSAVVFATGAVISGMTVISSFPSVRIYMTEQFPTNLRGRGYFFSEMAGRVIAGILIPFFIARHTASPVIFFGTMLVFALMGAFVPVLFGRETVGQLELVTASGGAVNGRGAVPAAVGAEAGE